MMDIQIKLCESTSEGIYVTIQGPSKEGINNPVGFWSLGLMIVAVLISLTNTLEPLKRSSENVLIVFFGPEMQNLSLTHHWVEIWFLRLLFILIGGQQQLQLLMQVPSQN